MIFLPLKIGHDLYIPFFKGRTDADQQLTDFGNVERPEGAFLDVNLEFNSIDEEGERPKTYTSCNNYEHDYNAGV